MTSAAHDDETVIPLDQAPPVAELAQRAGRHERIRLVAAGGDAVVVLSADEHQANIDDIVMLTEALHANSCGGIAMTEQCDHPLSRRPDPARSARRADLLRAIPRPLRRYRS
ncbi:MAG: hypothetical protein ACRDRP_13090 [Pseudonocardiaceae bacterium]